MKSTQYEIADEAVCAANSSEIVGHPQRMEAIAAAQVRALLAIAEQFERIADVLEEDITSTAAAIEALPDAVADLIEHVLDPPPSPLFRLFRALRDR